MDLYMEITFIDSDNQARKTGLGAAMKTNKKTKASFESNRPFEADPEDCQFLLDLRDSDDANTILDTICLNADRVEFLINQPVKSEEYYRDFDSRYWREAIEKYGKWKAQRAA